MLRAAMPVSRACVLAALLVLPALAGCRPAEAPSNPAGTPAATKPSRVSRAAFGNLPDDKPVEVFTLTNAKGVEAKVITYGAIVMSLKVPDRKGQLDDIVLGFDNIADYAAKNSPYMGAIVGRYANRIAKGQFTLAGKTHKLPANNGPNTLHGGIKGFDKVVWSGESFDDNRGAGVVLTYTSPDGEEGFPGTLTTRVTYTLTDKNELIVDYHATTDAPTVVNLSQHSYFNLAGQGIRDILEHEIQIHADRYTPVDEALIPTGELAPVEGTPFDFRKPMAIGARIEDPHVQMRRGNGYDHNFVLNGSGLRPAARVVDRFTGRTLDVSTTEPGMQLYTGNFLDGAIVGKEHRAYRQRTGFCLETQHFPDSPNHASFPSTTLEPGKEYQSRTVFAFGTEG
jgi:aldose 1-epimerase